MLRPTLCRVLVLRTSLRVETLLRWRYVLDLTLRFGPPRSITRVLRNGFQPALALLPILQGRCQVFDSPARRLLLELLPKDKQRGRGGELDEQPGSDAAARGQVHERRAVPRGDASRSGRCRRALRLSSR